MIAWPMIALTRQHTDAGIYLLEHTSLADLVGDSQEHILTASGWFDKHAFHDLYGTHLDATHLALVNLLGIVTGAMPGALDDQGWVNHELDQLDNNNRQAAQVAIAIATQGESLTDRSISMEHAISYRSFEELATDMVGKRLRLHTVSGAVYVGEVLAVGDELVEVEVPGTVVLVSIDAIEAVTVVPELGREEELR